MRTPKNIKEIEKRVKRNQPVNFAERNILKVFISKHRTEVKSKATVIPEKNQSNANKKKQ